MNKVNCLSLLQRRSFWKANNVDNFQRSFSLQISKTSRKVPRRFRIAFRLYPFSARRPPEATWPRSSATTWLGGRTTRPLVYYGRLGLFCQRPPVCRLQQSWRRHLATIAARSPPRPARRCCCRLRHQHLDLYRCRVGGSPVVTVKRRLDDRVKVSWCEMVLPYRCL